jgi:hypothetical protein
VEKRKKTCRRCHGRQLREASIAAKVISDAVLAAACFCVVLTWLSNFRIDQMSSVVLYPLMYTNPSSADCAQERSVVWREKKSFFPLNNHNKFIKVARQA